MFYSSTFPTTLIKALAITLCLLAPTIAANTLGFVQNNCPFAIYAQTSSGVNPPSGITLIPAGGSYQATMRPIPGGEGIDIKLSMTQNMGRPYVYQVEYAVKDGKVWYDLSDVDGHPFIDRPRYLQVGRDGECPTLWLAPGDRRTEWISYGKPEVCASTGDLWFYVC